MARYCTCGAMLDVNGLRKEIAKEFVTRWEAVHWKWSDHGSNHAIPVGKPGHQLSGGPVLTPGQHTKTGGTT